MLRIHRPRDGKFIIENDHGSIIAEFDTLSDAALVYRFLKGASTLTREEMEEARAIMVEYDKRTLAGKLAAEGGAKP